MISLTQAIETEINERVAVSAGKDIRGFYDLSKESHMLAYRVLTVLGIAANFETMNNIRDKIFSALSNEIELELDEEL